MRTLPLDEIADAIRLSGLPMQKARTIQAALADVTEESLDSLKYLPVAEARARLTSIRGVGDKTASCVLLFALGMPAQPVDTHIERVSKRLGINNGETSATGIQHVFEHCLPADGQTMYAFHVDMVRHGREVCQARAPKCGMCMLTDLCEYFAHVVTPYA
jgi:endonuclease-3